MEEDEEPNLFERIARELGMEPVPPPSEDVLRTQHKALLEQDRISGVLIRSLAQNDDNTLVRMCEWALAIVAYRNRCMPEDIRLSGPENISEWRRNQAWIERFLSGEGLMVDHDEETCELCRPS
jgi:hypothetical protein